MIVTIYQWSNQYNLGVISLAYRVDKNTRVAVYNNYKLATYLPFYIDKFRVTPFSNYD